MFYFGGTVPLVIGLLMFVGLPESLQFLTLRKKSLDKVGRWLKRVEPSVTITPATQFVVNEEKKKGVPIVTLFHEGRAAGTLLLWTMQFMNLINLYFLSTWLPTIARGHGDDDHGGGDGRHHVPDRRRGRIGGDRLADSEVRLLRRADRLLPGRRRSASG